MANREMKYSGVEWIGEIPKRWEVTKFKYVMKKDKKIAKKYNNENIISLTKSGVIIRDLENPFGKMPASFDGYQHVEEGDLLLCLFDIDVTPRCVGIVKNNGVTSPAYSRYKIVEGFDINYYNYLLTYLDDEKILLSYTKSLRNTLTDEYFGAVSTIKPSLLEQQKIAAFLDGKVAHIDNIIEDTKKSIRDLKIYKQSFITEVVTKGLDSTVDMQDSGVEYIGKIPSHWKFSKFKYLLTSPLKYGANESGVVYDDSKPRYIRITDILEGNKLINSNRQSLDEDKAKEYILKDGDLLFARSGATAGKTYMVNKNTPRSAFAGYLIKADVGDVDVSNYVYYYTLSKSYEEWKNSVVIQATIQNIGAEKYGDMFLPIPPKNEQIDIVEYLNKKVESIDLILEDKKLLLSEFESYKKALIYEYVTGKKEVK